jgi:hypothetical protein
VKLSANFLAGSAAALLGAAGLGSPALADYFGSINLGPGEALQVYTGPPSLNLRVCNDFSSSGTATVTIAENTPHDLQPGRCAEDIGDRITVQSHAGGQVTINYRALRDNQGHRFREHG